MNCYTVMRRFLPILVLLIPILISGCSDDATPTDPGDDLPANTPSIPTVANPTDELPATSDMLAVDDAPLGNFSPKVTANSSLVTALNAESIALEFRMVADYCRLVTDGFPCSPGALQWSTYGWENWSDCVPGTMSPCFEYLGSREDRHYYGMGHAAYWMVQDLNCRLVGTNLACIGSAVENTFVHDLRQDWQPSQYLALGFYDWGRTNNDWAWRNDEAASFLGWVGEEPNNSGGEYFCIMNSTNSGWNDINGVLPIYAIMETDELLTDDGLTEIPVVLLGESPLYLGDLGIVEDTPHIVRNVYWTKVFQTTLGAGATYSQEHSYTRGTSETNGMSFGWSIGISTEIGWGPVSTQIEMEFHQDFSHEVTVSEETTYTRTYECTAPADQTVVFALWQLRERYTICDSDGVLWSDSMVELDGDLPFLDQGLEQEYLQTIYFDQ